VCTCWCYQMCVRTSFSPGKKKNNRPILAAAARRLLLLLAHHHPRSGDPFPAFPAPAPGPHLMATMRDQEARGSIMERQSRYYRYMFTASGCTGLATGCRSRCHRCLRTHSSPSTDRENLNDWSAALLHMDRSRDPLGCCLKFWVSY